MMFFDPRFASGVPFATPVFGQPATAEDTSAGSGKKARTRSKSSDSEASAAEAQSQLDAMREPAVAAATSMMTPFAIMAETADFMRRSRALGMKWGGELAKCRSAQEMIEVNARNGERAMALGYTEAWRVLERSAMWGRAVAAPGSFALRDAKPKG